MVINRNKSGQLISIDGYKVSREKNPEIYRTLEGVNEHKRENVSLEEQSSSQKAQGKDGQVIGDQGKTPGRS